MKLYFTPGSCALSCHVALEWAGADYEAVRLTMEETKADAFLAVNPKGKVPALVMDDGTALTEALSILAWIAETWPEARLSGDTPAERAAALEALSEMTGEMHPAFAPLHVPGRYVDDAGAHDAVRAAARARVRGHYDRWNDHMAARDWVANGRRGIADAYLFAMGRWTGQIDADIAEWPALARFMDRMRADAGVQDALSAEGLD